MVGRFGSVHWPYDAYSRSCMATHGQYFGLQVRLCIEFQKYPEVYAVDEYLYLNGFTTRLILTCFGVEIYKNTSTFFFIFLYEKFFEVLDVFRNLLLAPPCTELREKALARERERRANGCVDSEKVTW